MKKKILLDASILCGIVNSGDCNHAACCDFYDKNKENSRFYIPAIAFFEFQATQSRKKIENNKEHAYREIYLNLVLYKITIRFIEKARSLNLFNKYEKLKGADLVYACVAKIGNLPLATNDKHFKSIENSIQIIWIN